MLCTIKPSIRFISSFGAVDTLLTAPLSPGLTHLVTVSTRAFMDSSLLKAVPKARTVPLLLSMSHYDERSGSSTSVPTVSVQSPPVPYCTFSLIGEYSVT